MTGENQECRLLAIATLIRGSQLWLVGRADDQETIGQDGERHDPHVVTAYGDVADDLHAHALKGQVGSVFNPAVGKQYC